MRGCEGHLGKVVFDQIIKEIYGDISSPCSENDSKYLSLGFVAILMEMTWSLIDKEVLRYDHNTLDDNYISKLRSNKYISSTGNEEDILLEPCVICERVCITRPRGLSYEYFYFYSGVIEDFKICIPFTKFEFDLLKTLNITPSFSLSWKKWTKEAGFPLVGSQGKVSSRLILWTTKASKIIFFK